MAAAAAAAVAAATGGSGSSTAAFAAIPSVAVRGIDGVDPSSATGDIVGLQALRRGAPTTSALAALSSPPLLRGGKIGQTFGATTSLAADWVAAVAATTLVGVFAARQQRRRRRACGPVTRGGNVLCAAVASAPVSERQDASREAEGPSSDRDAFQVEEPSRPIATGLSAQAELRYMRPLWPGLDGDEIVKFGDLEIPRRLKDALQDRGIVEPSGIQEAVMPRIARGDHVIVHAPTGGGKTLAFLLPLLARLQPTLHVGMQVLILVPTPELALQTCRELRWLVDAVCGPNGVLWFNPQVPKESACEVLLSRSALWDAVGQDHAVLISTPALIKKELRALQHQAKKFTETLAYFVGSNIDAIVLDEVDAMFPALPARRNKRDEKHGAAEQVIEFIFDVVRCRYRNRPVQMVCASATANGRKVRATLERLQEGKYPKQRDAGRRQTPALIQHAARVGSGPARTWKGDEFFPHVVVPQGIVHALAEMPGEDDRFGVNRIAEAARIATRLTGTILVMVPDDIKLDAMVMALQSAGIPDAAKHRAVVGLSQDLDQLQDEELAAEKFVKKRKGQQPFAQKKLSQEARLQGVEELAGALANGERRVLVAKSAQARGVDLEGVAYVLLLRLPSLANDYMHLAGRTGRMGRTGHVIAVASPEDMDFTSQRIEERLNITFKGWDTVAGEAFDFEDLDDDVVADAGPDGREDVSVEESPSAESPVAASTTAGMEEDPRARRSSAAHAKAESPAAVSTASAAETESFSAASTAAGDEAADSATPPQNPVAEQADERAAGESPKRAPNANEVKSLLLG